MGMRLEQWGILLKVCGNSTWFRSRVEEPLCQEETKKLKPSVPGANDFGDCICVDDVEDEEATMDHPMPMSLEKPYTSTTEVEPMVNIIWFLKLAKEEVN